MRRTQLSVRQRSHSAHALANDWFNILFEQAPFMMHSIDKDGRLIRVNRLWLKTLEYETNEVLGRKSTDFLTEESRTRAIKDTLPLFWRTGSARSVGYTLVRKDGQLLDVLLDAEAVSGTARNAFTIALFREGPDPSQSEEASNTLAALKDITTVMHTLERVNVAHEGDEPAAASLAVGQSPGQVQADVPGEATGAFLELAQDISTNLRGLLRVHEEWLSESVEHQRELLLVARSLDKTLAELADTLAAVRLRPE